MLNYLAQVQRGWRESGKDSSAQPTKVTGLSGRQQEMSDAVQFADSFLQAYQDWHWLWSEEKAFNTTTAKERYTATELAVTEIITGKLPVIRRYVDESFFVTIDGTRRKLQEEKQRQFWKALRASGASRSGPPQRYHIYPDKSVEFGPDEMDQAYNIDFEFHRKGNLLEANSDEPAYGFMDDEFDDAIWGIAVVIASEKRSAVDRSEAARSWLAEWMTRMQRNNLDDLGFRRSRFLDNGGRYAF